MLFKIDFTRPHLYEDVVTLNQGNLSTNNTLRCRIATGGNDDVTGASIVCTFVINGKQIFESGKVVDGPRGIVDVIFPSEALVVGENTLEFLVNRIDGSVAQSPVIKYRVWQGLTTDEGVKADSNYPLLVELINQANSAVNSANEALEGANSVIVQGDELKASVDKLKADCIASVDSFTEESAVKIDNAISQNVAKVDAAIVKNEASVVKADAAAEKAILAANNSDTKTAENIKNVNAAIAAGTQDLEVKAARVDMDGVEHGSLKERLESDLKKGKLIEETKEGTYLSFNDTVGGIVSDIEVLGNTVQDASNLANIKSSCIPNGDGTFKMSILSVGENLWNIGSVEHGKTYYVKLPMGQFTFSLVASSATSARVGIFVVNEDNSALSSKVITNNVSTSITFTNSKVQNVGFKIGGWDSGATLQSTKDIKLQEGTVATPYTPYEETRCDIKLPCQLEKWDRLYFDKEENAWCVEKGTHKATNFIYDAPNNVYKIDISKEPKWIPKSEQGWNKVSGLALSNKGIEVGEWTTCKNTPNSIFLDHSGAQNPNIALNTTDITGAYILCKLATPKKIVLPQSEQIKLNSFANKTHIYTISGDVDATVKATVSKSLASTVQANTDEINILSDKIADIQGLKESQDFAYETDKGYLVCKDTQNGVVKDLKVYGKSLINVWNVSEWMKVNTQIVATDKTGTSVMQIPQKDNIFNAGDIVTVVADISVDNPTYCYWQVNYMSTTGEEKSLKNITFNSGIKSFAIQLPSDYSHMRCIFVGVQAGNTRTFKNNGCMCIKGDLSGRIPSYFEGIGSVGNGNEIEVLSRKEDGNLFNISDFKRYILGLGSEYSSYLVRDSRNCWYPTNYGVFHSKFMWDIRLDENVSYVIKFDYYFESANQNKGLYFRVYYTDGSFEYPVWGEQNKWSTAKITTNPNKAIAYIHMTYGESTNKTWIDLDSIVIAKAKNYNDKLENKQDKKTILFKDADNTWKPILNLRGIDENNCDIVDSVNNVFHENITEIIFNGDSSENWSLQKTENGKSQFTMSAKRSGIKPNSKILSDKYNNITSSQFANMEVGIFNGSAWGIVVNDASVTDVQSLKTKLQSNNVKINVQLLENKSYEINPLFPNSFDNETMILIGSGVIAPRASWKITSSLPNFVQSIEDRVSRLENDAYKVNLANFTVALNMLDMKARLESLEAPIN